ncbi:Monogalactosyldiacylglycerol synthase [Desulfitobacterium hafniense DCB-2]|uniref:Monogalactosyldiacylglycerol synthase n=1 Tax=Desulfitobacterium hafniense (strain DSM 10664 / DCB-2) TaxID=272564 RepID=B8G1E6_DESHD|nr:glycosyltransferase [Desulfitobacterium hafniense]ACL21199.1 Monogalactosyldiacylglycerol synthase [Desulfitobacterium hafniense DCB-2]
MSNLRVLVISAAFGAGHIKAAEAVIEAIWAKRPNTEIYHADFGAFLNKAFHLVIKTAYIDMIKYTPKLWGEFYYRTSDIPSDSLFQRFLNGLGRQEFISYIHSVQPDLIVCTYPTIAGVLAQLKEKRILTVPLAAVVTDYAIHNQWVHQGVDLYLVGSQEVADGLAQRGINPGCLKVTGIPVSPKFEIKLDREELARKFGLDPGQPTILVMGGAYGVLDNATGICRLIMQNKLPVQLLIVCGRDKRLYSTLEPLVRKAENRVLLFEFVENVEELMTVSDLMITKAGGLTVSEALTKQLPMVIYKPIPGQEKANSEFLRRVGTGKIAATEGELLQILTHLLENPEEIKLMSHAAAKLPRRTAETAADYLLELFRQRNRVRKVG